ncbi:MAG TPA: FAD-binding oxidoreductase [Acidisarcina sp.]
MSEPMSDGPLSPAAMDTAANLEAVHSRVAVRHHAEALAALLHDARRVLTNPQVVGRLSRDFFWYSPILRPLLEGKSANMVVQPATRDEVRDVLRYCYAQDLPVTARGSGTGNYGQAVPLERGVVLDLSRFDALLSITPDGVAICEPGLRLGSLEAEARAAGWELRCYPSTVVKASVGGFLGGGSGGIGSVTHGGLRDFNTVRALEVVTMEAEPRMVMHEGEAVHDILHAWGTNGIITRIWLALTPAVEWAQCAIAFNTFLGAFDFAETVATGERWTKRLVTVFEWPIPSFFTSLSSLVIDGSALVFITIALEQLPALKAAAEAAGGRVTFSGPQPNLRTVPLLSDFTWNHTTLWAIRADPAYTYLQCGFDPLDARAQFAKLKGRYKDQLLLHIEFMKRGDGVVVPGAIPVVRYLDAERLNEMIDHCRQIGVSVANPHVNHVEGGGRYREDAVQLLAKRRYDPKGLLNPGKMATFRSLDVSDGYETGEATKHLVTDIHSDGSMTMSADPEELQS